MKIIKIVVKSEGDQGIVEICEKVGKDAYEVVHVGIINSMDCLHKLSNLKGHYGKVEERTSEMQNL